MKRRILALAACAVLGSFAADVKLATREWVTNYIARSISASRAELAASATLTTSNGFTVVEAGSGQSAVRLVYQNPADAALEATNCTVAAQAPRLSKYRDEMRGNVSAAREAMSAVQEELREDAAAAREAVTTLRCSAQEQYRKRRQDALRQLHTALGRAQDYVERYL